MNTNKNYRISIMGDSISTYEGYNPIWAKVYYKDDVTSDNGLSSVDDTWWEIVIDSLDSTLCVNNSHSGSLVSGSSYTCANSEYRCNGLHDANTPDLILIYMGTNDRGHGVKIESDDPEDVMTFCGAYRTMLKKIKRNYPNAIVVCGTLLLGYLQQSAPPPALPPFNEEVEAYNRTIRALAEEENCLVADLAAFGERYETQDTLHPTKNGHLTIAKLWLNCLKRLLP